MRSFTVALVLLAALASAWDPSTAAARLNDADVVVVLPTASKREARDIRRLLAPWVERVRRQHRETTGVRLKVAFVTLGAAAPAGGQPTAEALRQHLRSRFASRRTTTERPRYLAIAALPYAGYAGAAGTLATVPRFSVTLRDVPAAYSVVPSDVPYGFLEPATIDGGDGFVDPADLDMARATFTVFRIPLASVDDVRHFVDRSNAFAVAPSRRDVTLVAGEFGLFAGDTSLIQCTNATQIASLGTAGRIATVLDSTAACAPDYLSTWPSHRLADYLSDPAEGHAGGVIYDVSHGSGDAIYAESSIGSYVNLGLDDLSRIPTGRLNVFVSISCDNDAVQGGRNFAMGMYAHDSVAVVSATANIFPTSVEAILAAEIDAFVALYESPITLLQGLHRFRADYYARDVLGGPAADRPYNWLNLFAVHVLGDGLTVVSR